MLEWKRKRTSYGQSPLVLYAGKQKVGCVQFSLTGTNFIAKTYLPMNDGNDSIIHRGSEAECMSELSEYTRNWFYNCGYVIDINSSVNKPIFKNEVEIEDECD